MVNAKKSSMKENSLGAVPYLRNKKYQRYWLKEIDLLEQYLNKYIKEAKLTETIKMGKEGRYHYKFTLEGVRRKGLAYLRDSVTAGVPMTVGGLAEHLGTFRGQLVQWCVSDVKESYKKKEGQDRALELVYVVKRLKGFVERWIECDSLVRWNPTSSIFILKNIESPIWEDKRIQEEGKGLGVDARRKMLKRLTELK